MKKITLPMLLIFISITLMIGIGCRIFEVSSESPLIIGGGSSEGSSSPRYKIVFQNFRSQNFSEHRIYIVNEDGSGLRYLDRSADSPNIERWVMWSPKPINDRYKIVFNENDGIAIINENESTETYLWLI
jgi:hypothetical protein